MRSNQAKNKKNPNQARETSGAICERIVVVVCILAMLFFAGYMIVSNNQNNKRLIYVQANPSVGDLIQYSDGQWRIITEVEGGKVVTKVLYERERVPLRAVLATDENYEAVKRHIMLNGAASDWHPMGL